MAYMSIFAPETMTLDQYNEAMHQLEAAGAQSPRGRIIHVCYGDAPKLQILTVWDSQDDFRTMAPTLLPILRNVGIEVSGPPSIYPVHDIQPAPDRDMKSL